MWPAFLKTNVTLPGFPIDLVDSLKKYSPPLTWIVVAVADVCRSVRAEASGTSASEAIATAAKSETGPIVSLFIAEAPCRLVVRLRKGVGDQLELRLLQEPGRGRADEQRVAVDRRERVDAGRSLRRPERLAGLGVERVDRARVVAREDDIVGDRGGPEVHRRQLLLPEHLARGGVDRGEAAAAGIEAGHAACDTAREAGRARARREVEPGDEETALGERHRRLDAAQVTREDVDQLARQRPGVVLVLADRARPETLSVVGAIGVDLA